MSTSSIESIRGNVIHPGDAEYDSARSVWNGMIDRSPAVIVQCLDVADVVNAVNSAREAGLGIAVRGGGHNAAGLAVADGALVVDLSKMRSVEVDPVARRARAEGGATWGDFDRATHAHGLATTGGAISMTGIGGLTLGGGIGWLMRSCGLACDNLIAAELVTADGSIISTSESENPELLWGLRGGGGNFGVVTSFTFQLYPVDTVLGGLLVHPADRAAEVLRFYRDFTRSAPDELAVFAALMTSPDGMPMVGLIVAYNGPIEEGERIVRPLREFGPPLADQIAPMPYIALQSMIDEGFPSGLSVYWRSNFVNDLSDDAIDTIVDGFAHITSPLSAILLEHLGGAVARVGRDDTAFDHRDAEYNLAIIARWSDPTMEDAGIAWARDLWSAMQPFTRGVYVNYLGVGESASRVREAYGADKYQRLAHLKHRYDPDNRFRFNQNIEPMAPGTT